MMLAVDAIALELKKHDLPLFSFPGGTICALYDACHRHDVEIIVARSEFGAGYMAVGAAKTTGQPQVVAVTSGPGATNLITPLADAYYDSVPIIALTGQVATPNLGYSVRQRGFQQTDIVSMVAPVTRFARIYMTPNELAIGFRNAFSQVMLHRPAPILLDMPTDVQKGEIGQMPERTDNVRNDYRTLPDGIRQLGKLIAASRRPVFIVGAGCRNAYQSLRSLVERLGVPTVASLPAVGILPTYSPCYFGMVGHTGHPCANWVVQHSDLIVALGARLDVRQTGTETDKFAPEAKIARVDIDAIELNNSRVRCDLAIRTRCWDVLEVLGDKLIGSDWFENWTTECGEKYYDISVPNSQFARVIGEIDEQYKGDAIFVTGVGSHQQHAARHLTLDYPKRMLITSSGHGCMGAGLPMSIGAALETGKQVVLVDGDGSFQLSMNELGTWMTHYPRIDLNVHIINNRSGGIVSQFARFNNYDPRETTWINPDFKAIAEAYGLNVTVHNVEEEGVWPILESGQTEMTWPEGNK